MIGIIIVYFIFIILFILTFKIKNKKLDSLTKMSTIIYILLSKIKSRKIVKKPDIVKNIKSLYFQNYNGNKLIDAYYVKKIKKFLIIIFIGNTLASFSFASYLINSNSLVDFRLNKSNPGEGTKKQELMIRTEDIEEKVQIELAEYKYSEKEFKEIIEKNYSRWQDVIADKNKSLNSITSNINLTNKFLEYPFDINYIIEEKDIINDKGEINFFNIKKPKKIDIKVIISYGEYSITKNINIRINNLPIDEVDKIKSEIIREVNVQNNNTNLKSIILPRLINKKKIYYGSIAQDNSLVILFASIIIAIIVYLNEDKKLKEKVRDRKMELKVELPLFLSKLAILNSAGLSISNAIIRISSNKKNNSKILYSELKILANKLKSGMSIRQALEEFSEKIDIPEYSKLCTMLYSNIKKGGNGLSEQLLLNAKSIYKDKDAVIKVKTEKAGTKLLIPMGMMLGVVLLITIIPAFINI